MKKKISKWYKPENILKSDSNSRLNYFQKPYHFQTKFAMNKPTQIGQIYFNYLN
jgi:hypothetical protein